VVKPEGTDLVRLSFGGEREGLKKWKETGGGGDRSSSVECNNEFIFVRN
jgi:hypothetical protein